MAARAAVCCPGRQGGPATNPTPSPTSSRPPAGPTTFIIPGECFPTRYRSTCHGLSAASGKAGAIVGLYGFGNIAAGSGYPAALGALAAFMFGGLLCTYFVPETRGKSLEELGEERQQEQEPPAVK